MKKKVGWSLAAASTLSILVGWLQLVLGRQVLLYTLLVVAAFALGWLAPHRSGLAALILTAGIPLLHFIWINLDLVSHDPFSWMGDVILPIAFSFPAALFGASLGWMHNIVKDDF